MVQFLGLASQKLSPRGEPLGRFATNVQLVTDVAVDGTDNIYVVDAATGLHVVKLSPKGERLAEHGVACEGCDILVPKRVAVGGDGNIYVTYRHEIVKLSQNLVLLDRWGGPGSGLGQFWYAADVAVDRDGNVYVADAGNHRIQKLTVAGQTQGE